MNQNYSKSLPSDIDMTKKTFLNDGQIYAEIYAELLAYSEVIYEGKDPYTFCQKKYLKPSELAKKYGCSRQTIYNRLNYLEKQGYIETTEEGYRIYCSNAQERENNITPKWLSLPISTLKYLITIFNAPVIKTYIYLGVMYKLYQRNHKLYNFSKQDIVEHCGLPKRHSTDLGSRKGEIKKGLVKHSSWDMAQIILEALKDNELINFRQITMINNKGIPYPHYELIYWTDTKKITEIEQEEKTTTEKQNQEDAEIVNKDIKKNGLQNGGPHYNF